MSTCSHTHTLSFTLALSLFCPLLWFFFCFKSASPLLPCLLLSLANAAYEWNFFSAAESSLRLKWICVIISRKKACFVFATDFGSFCGFLIWILHVLKTHYYAWFAIEVGQWANGLRMWFFVISAFVSCAKLCIWDRNECMLLSSFWVWNLHYKNLKKENFKRK